MKKVLIGLAVVAFGFTFASCTKTCDCKTYLAGAVVLEKNDIELEKGKKCSDLNTFVVDSNGQNKTGVECK
ncbi:hypothetical protein LJC25_03045 [Bacteroidales bacterium OttesenSCG-928-K03]|nr:hypothetical protein [Odoribacter sp. OttesenSCG-928-L07]MDL2242686.1 hypothetical protein [Bacteroidales bacterium OttesenSCG-928-K03]